MSVCPPYPLYICMFSLYHMFPLSWGLRDICTTLMSWGLLEDISTSVRHLFVSTSFTSQFITAIPVAPHYCGLLLYWTACLWMSAMLHAVVPFIVVFIMSQASTTMSMTTTPPVTYVLASMSFLLSMVTMATS